MNHAQPLQITTIYDAGGFAGAAAGRRMLGLLALMIAVPWLYFTWWTADTYIGKQLLTATITKPSPVAIDFARLLGALPSNDEGAPPPDVVEASAKTEQALKVGASASYVWLAVMTVGACMLVIFGSSAMTASLLPKRAGPMVSVIGVLLLLAVGGVAFLQLRRFELGYEWVRVLILCVAGAAFVIGMGLNRRSHATQWAAGIGVIVAALATAAGLYLAGKYELFPAQWTTMTRIVMVFIVQAAFGFFLILQMLLTR